MRGRPLLAVPVVCALLALGVLAYDHFRPVNSLAFGLAVVTMLAVVTRLVLTLRENSRLFAQTLHDAATDALTGLGNRRQLVEDVSRRLGQPNADPALLMTSDLDGLEAYNDTFGHPAGDALLARLGGKLAAAVGSAGAAYRLGGDEFCLVAAASLDEVEQIMERASAALSEHSDGFHVSSSFGAVLLPDEASTASEALRLADERLYSQKRSRRAEGDGSIEALLDTLSVLEPGLQGHLRGVTALALAAARSLGLRGGELDDLARAARLHDLGKIAVPEEIPRKPGPLDEREWAFIRQHTLVGERILRASPALHDVATIVRSTHERWDGSGYPDGLAGERIPLASRIICACDAYDAMTSARLSRGAHAGGGARRARALRRDALRSDRGARRRRARARRDRSRACRRLTGRSLGSRAYSIRGPVAQRIERQTSNLRAEVRLLPGPWSGIRPVRLAPCSVPTTGEPSGARVRASTSQALDLDRRWRGLRRRDDDRDRRLPRDRRDLGDRDGQPVRRRRDDVFDIDVNGWGWVHLTLGVVVLLAGWALLSGRPWGARWASCSRRSSPSATSSGSRAYPLWSTVVVAMSAWVSWAPSRAERCSSRSYQPVAGAGASSSFPSSAERWRAGRVCQTTHMGSSLELGRIAGIRIGVHWSWLAVFALFVWSLAASVFPSTNPGLSSGTHLAMAFVAAALFFLSVLLHELGHALQARRERIEIEGITLWLFGGVATLKGAFETAGAEFRVAVAGPIVSLFLGVLFVSLALLDPPQAVEGVVAWLGYVNIALLVFNLAPAVPLDGGRILHAALWHRSGDFGRSTVTATRIGRGFGYVLVSAGVALALTGNAFGGVWLAVLGWFLLSAASAEGRYAAARRALEGLRVADLMARDPVTVHPELTLGQVMDDVVWKRRFTTYPVADDGLALGLLAFRKMAEVPRSEWDLRRVRDCMLPLSEVPVYREEEDALEAFETLSQTGLGRGLVVDRGGGRLVGLLSVTDLARALEAPPRRRTAG